MRIPGLVALTTMTLMTAGTPIATADGPPPELLAELSASMRGLIEPGFEANLGFGFASFECRVESELVAGSRFDCDAVDMEGDEIRYTLEVDDEGMASVVLASQPADALSPSDRALLDPPCRRFLDRYAERDWNALIADLDPALLEISPPEEIRAELIPVREALGELRSAEAVTYARNATGRHEMEFALDCADGPGFARFGLAIEHDRAVVTAFVVSPTPGSAVHARLLAVEGREKIAALTGESVDHIVAPIEQLQHVGDTVDGTAMLTDGRELIIGVVQQGRTDDFDTIDYRFQVLEVSWLLTRAYASAADPATAVDCPSRTAPDGGTMTCRVTFGSGVQRDVTVARRSGDHRIVDSQPVGG
jgi:hypothetical protein